MNKVQNPHETNESMEARMANRGEAAMLNVFRKGPTLDKYTNIEGDDVKLAEAESNSIEALKTTVRDILLAKAEPLLKKYEADAASAALAEIQGGGASEEGDSLEDKKAELYAFVEGIVDVITEMRAALQTPEAVGVAAEDAQFKSETVNALGGSGDLNLIVENPATADQLKQKITQKAFQADTETPWQAQQSERGFVLHNSALDLRIVVLVRDVKDVPMQEIQAKEADQSSEGQVSEEEELPMHTGTNESQIGQVATMPQVESSVEVSQE